MASRGAGYHVGKRNFIAARATGNETLIGIKLTERSDIPKYSIFNFDSSGSGYVRLKVGLAQAKRRTGGTSFTDCIELANAAQWIRYWARPTIIKKGFILSSILLLEGYD